MIWCISDKFVCTWIILFLSQLWLIVIILGWSALKIASKFPISSWFLMQERKLVLRAQVFTRVIEYLTDSKKVVETIIPWPMYLLLLSGSMEILLKKINNQTSNSLQNFLNLSCRILALQPHRIPASNFLVYQNQL